MAYLRSLTAPGGEVRYSRTSSQTPVWVTGQALAALAGKTLPLARVPRAHHATATAATAAADGHAGRRRRRVKVQSLPPVATAVPAAPAALAAAARVPAAGLLLTALL